MKLTVIVAAAILLSTLVLVFGFYGYPVRAINDATAYLVPGIHMAMTGKLENPMVWTGNQAPHSGPFVTHMPLFQILFHFFISPARSTSLPLQVFIVIAVINAVVIALSARGLYQIGTMNSRKLDWPATILICVALFMILRASWSFGGRDETLVRLLFTVGFLFALNVRRSFYLACILGVILGAIAATSTFAAVFFTALIWFVFAMKHDHDTDLLHTIGTSSATSVPRGPVAIWRDITAVGDRKCILNAAIAIVVGIFAFIIIMQLSPYSIAATYRGLFTIAYTTAGDTISVQRNVLAIFKSSYVFLYAAISLLLVFFGLRIYLRAIKHRQIVSPLLILFSAMAAAFYVAFVVINGFRLYYIAPFLLLFFSAVLFYVTRVQDSKFTKYSMLLLFTFLIAVSLKHLALFPFFLKDGKTLPAARVEFEQAVARNPAWKISLGGSRMWALSEDYARMVTGDVPPEVGKYLYVREEEEHPELPIQFSSCTLRDNFYTAKTPSIFGVPLNRATPGYGFAVYECGP